MTAIQHDADGQLNALWQHTYPEGEPDHKLGLYLFDAEGKPLGSVQLNAESRARLRQVLNRE